MRAARFAPMILGMAGCFGSPWTPHALSVRQPPAAVTRFTPSTPRFVHQPTELAPARLEFASLSVHVVDARPHAESLHGDVPALARAPLEGRADVPLPPDSTARLAPRAAEFVSGQGPAATLQGRVTALFVERPAADTRVITARVQWSLGTANNPRLFEAPSEVMVQLSTPPHDRAELDDVHLSVFLKALDDFVAGPERIELINLKLNASPPPSAPAPPA